MISKLDYTALSNVRDGAEAEYSIAPHAGETRINSEFIISLQRLDHGSSVLSPQMHVFEDGLPALVAFTMSGAMQKLMIDVPSPAEFERRLAEAGIWMAS